LSRSCVAFVGVDELTPPATSPLLYTVRQQARAKRLSSSTRTRVRTRADASSEAVAAAVSVFVKNPAFLNSGSELQQLKALSQVVHDAKGAVDAGHSLMNELGAQAATVSAGVLMAVLKQNNTGDVGALEGAMVGSPQLPLLIFCKGRTCTTQHTLWRSFQVYRSRGKRHAEHRALTVRRRRYIPGWAPCAAVWASNLNPMDSDTEDQRLDCIIDKAFVNLGAMMSARVDGGANPTRRLQGRWLRTVSAMPKARGSFEITMLAYDACSEVGALLLVVHPCNHQDHTTTSMLNSTVTRSVFPGAIPHNLTTRQSLFKTRAD